MLDDCMYVFNKSKNEDSGWGKENEKMKKRLEKSSINLMKIRVT